MTAEPLRRSYATGSSKSAETRYSAAFDELRTLINDAEEYEFVGQRSQALLALLHVRRLCLKLVLRIST